MFPINLKSEGWSYLEFDKTFQGFLPIARDNLLQVKSWSLCISENFQILKLEKQKFWSSLEVKLLPPRNMQFIPLRISNQRELLRCSIMRILKYLMLPARIFNFEKKPCISCFISQGQGRRWRVWIWKCDFSLILDTKHQWMSRLSIHQNWGEGP